MEEDKAIQSATVNSDVNSETPPQENPKKAILNDTDDVITEATSEMPA